AALRLRQGGRNGTATSPCEVKKIFFRSTVSFRLGPFGKFQSALEGFARGYNSMKLRSVCFAALFALILAAGSAAPCFAISKEFNQTYPLQPGGTFELQNVNGTVDVQTWDRNEVEVRAVKTAKRKESDLDLVSIDVDARRDSVSVTTRYPQNEGVEVAVEYTVHVPRCAHVEHLGTVNGT